MRKRLREGTLDDTRDRDRGRRGARRRSTSWRRRAWKRWPSSCTGCSRRPRPGARRARKLQDRRRAEAADRRGGRQAGQRRRDPRRTRSRTPSRTASSSSTRSTRSRRAARRQRRRRVAPGRAARPAAAGRRHRRSTPSTASVKTDHILFIASGAFHLAKPSDLIPELQGRFPIRVELASLSVDDFEAILTSTHASLVKQYQALLATEGVTLEITPDGIRRLAQIAFEVNERTENIGARRLSTVMERLLDEVSFDAPQLSAARRCRSTPAPSMRSSPSWRRTRTCRATSCSRRALSATRRRAARACNTSRPSKISDSTVSKCRSVIGASFTAAPPVISSSGSHAGARGQLARGCARSHRQSHGAAAHQRIAGVGREIDDFAGRHLQAGRAHFERAQHEAEARQDQPAEESAVRVERIDGHGGADHHHQRRVAPAPAASTRWRAPISATQRSAPSRSGWS